MSGGDNLYIEKFPHKGLALSATIYLLLALCEIYMFLQNPAFLKAEKRLNGIQRICSGCFGVVRGRGVLRVICYETGPSARVRVRASPVKNLLRNGYEKHSLHAFQGREKHYGRSGAPQKEDGGRAEQPPERPPWRCTCGECFTLMMPKLSHNCPSTSER